MDIVCIDKNTHEKGYKMEEKKRNSFGGSIGFVLAAAGSAVGLGNIWRFPYLAAKDGGGLFLVVYIILALTFGFTLLTSEICIGRKTKQSPLTAYGKLKPGFKGLGWIACIVPGIILPYYCVIGGWVLKYFIAFLTGHGFDTAADGYFVDFITKPGEPLITLLIFLGATAVIVYLGVDKGIEATSKVLMPILIILIMGISVYSLTLNNSATGEAEVRTGMQGLKILVVPNLKGLTVKQFFTVLVDAMGQLFYSLSVAMGIMIAYGSYVKKETDLNKSIGQIELFDTLVAFLAGLMIIPAVYVFMGNDGLANSGTSLMFVALPKVFVQMGSIGNVIGTIFFAMVLFAAITSSVSLMEAVVSSFIDASKKGMSRSRATTWELIISLVIGGLVSLGYSVLYFEAPLPGGVKAQLLDILDYASNNCLMPVLSILTCVLVGWVLKPQFIIDEMKQGGVKFKRKKLYIVMVKFVAPILLLILFLRSIGIITFI